MATSVKLKFLPSKVSGKEGAVCLQLIHNRKIKLLRTRFKLFHSEWDERKNTVDLRECEAKRQNRLIAAKAGLEAELRQANDLIRVLKTKGDFTVSELAALHVSNSFNGCLFPFIEHTVKQLKDNNRKKSATILLTAKRSFKRFRNGQDISLDKLDGDLMQRYEIFLKQSGMLKNTVSCYMRSLRSAYNQAVKQGLTEQRNPFANVYTGIDKTIKRAVNEDVILKLKNLDLAGNTCLAFARDLFLFSFYMRGISFVDMANLRKSNVQNGYIVYFRSKTRQMLTVKIEPCMQEIISRYEAQTVDDYLLPIFTAANRIHASQLRNYNKRLRRISETLGLDKPISSYVSRHTWATIALRRGIPIEIISESMGHENEATTRIYLASLGQAVVDRANAEIIRLE
ncbi:MAG: site-specific integrase [Dysgonamonadaceae bacterium]|jgi:integrase|nr:site-specific integrase [Dysgonamonadaceae bacterium]